MGHYIHAAYYSLRNLLFYTRKRRISQKLAATLQAELANGCIEPKDAITDVLLGSAGLSRTGTDITPLIYLTTYQRSIRQMVEAHGYTVKLL